MNATATAPKAWINNTVTRSGGGQEVVIVSRRGACIENSRVAVLCDGSMRIVSLASDRTAEEVMAIARDLISWKPDLGAMADAVGCSVDQVAAVLAFVQALPATQRDATIAAARAHVAG